MIETPNLDAAIDAVAERAATEGWRSSIIDAAGQDGVVFFPAGIVDALRALHEKLDRDMIACAGSLEELRLSQRVRALVAARLEASVPYRDALRRVIPFGLNPRYGVLLTKLLAKTVDLIWHEAGDRSADANWYSKRAILAGVYGRTILYWLRQSEDDNAASLDFLDRRLAEVALFGKSKKRVMDFASGIVSRFQGAA